MQPYATLSDPLTEIWQGDCREILPNWLNAFDFAFADPPFNIGQAYDVHDDRMDDVDFADFTTEWIQKLCCSVRLNGVIVIHIPDTMAQKVLNICSAFGLTRIDWIIWHYRFAVNQSLDTARGFLSSKAHALVYRKGSGLHTFNAHSVAVPSDRASKYNDSRIHETTNGGSRVPLDVWTEFSRVQGNNKERSGLSNHPNQLPEKYLERFIRAYTNVGDYIIDPFAGTGTTATVARSLKRDCVTIEKSLTYCEDIKNRCLKGAVNVTS